MFVNSGRRIAAPTPEAIAEAAGIIREGGLVAFPTETVYGLGANGLDEGAVERIFAAKGRPQDNPLILHLARIGDAEKYAETNETADRLMQQFWPGPLTIVLYALDVVPAATRAGLDTVALRMPYNAVALDLIRECRLPLAAPSANRSGRPSPTTAEAVFEDLGKSVDMILDGGATSIGLESTVVDASEGAVSILRPGGVTREMLRQVVDLCEGDALLSLRSPGNRHRHYAPRVPLLLWNARADEADRIFQHMNGESWAYLGVSAPPASPVPPLRALRFSSPEAYAQGLFAALRELESCGCTWLLAELPEPAGIGEALRNRLQRAAEED